MKVEVLLWNNSPSRTVNNACVDLKHSERTNSKNWAVVTVFTEKHINMVRTALCDREKAALCRSLMAFHTIRLFDSFGNTEAVVEIHTSAFRNQKHVCRTVQCKIKEMSYFALFSYIFDIHFDYFFALCIHFLCFFCALHYFSSQILIVFPKFCHFCNANYTSW